MVSMFGHVVCVMLASGTSLATQSCSCEGNILTEPSFLSHQTCELNLHGTTNLVSRQISGNSLKRMRTLFALKNFNCI